jgi:hypothetical protein
MQITNVRSEAVRGGRLGQEEQMNNLRLMQKRKAGQIRSLDWVVNVVERMRVRERNDVARGAFEDVLRAVGRQREKEIYDLSLLDENEREIRVGSRA